MIIKIEYRFQAFPPCLENFRRGRGVQTVILVQPDRTAHLQREYVQLIGAGSVATFAGLPCGYGRTRDGMRWDRYCGMGHMWAAKDSPAAEVTRYGHGLTRRHTREKTGQRTRLAKYFWQNCGTDVIEISGVVGEPR